MAMKCDEYEFGTILSGNSMKFLNVQEVDKSTETIDIYYELKILIQLLWRNFMGGPLRLASSDVFGGGGGGGVADRGISSGRPQREV